MEVLLQAIGFGLEPPVFRIPAILSSGGRPSEFAAREDLPVFSDEPGPLCKRRLRRKPLLRRTVPYQRIEQNALSAQRPLQSLRNHSRILGAAVQCKSEEQVLG